jgi:hypothetical protein
MHEPQTEKEMLAAMWVWAARMPDAFQVQVSKDRLGPDRGGESMGELVLPLLFTQTQGGHAQVKARWEKLRAALTAAREARVGPREGAELIEALEKNLAHLEQNIGPAAIAAEEAFRRHGFVVDDEGHVVEAVQGQRGRRAKLVAIAARNARERLVSEKRLPKTSRVDARVCAAIREELAGVFEDEALSDATIGNALRSALYPKRHDVSK